MLNRHTGQFTFVRINYKFRTSFRTSNKRNDIGTLGRTQTWWWFLSDMTHWGANEVAVEQICSARHNWLCFLAFKACMNELNSGNEYVMTVRPLIFLILSEDLWLYLMWTAHVIFLKWSSCSQTKRFGRLYSRHGVFLGCIELSANQFTKKIVDLDVTLFCSNDMCQHLNMKT